MNSPSAVARIKSLIIPAGVLALVFLAPSFCWGTIEASSAAALTRGNSRFSFSLYSRLEERKGNLFFSPLSVSSALAMTSAGARGETAAEMADVLQFPDGESLHGAFYSLLEELKTGQAEGVRLEIANRLWGQTGFTFLKSFRELTETYYGAALAEIDFSDPETARKIINRWVEKNTGGLIKDLIGPGVLGPLVRLVLTNAVYFKGEWEEGFDKEATETEDFHLSADRKVAVAMMRRKGDYGYFENENLKVLELPYRGETFSMIICLPARVDGLKDLEKSLSRSVLEQWLEEQKIQNVRVFLPRFRLTSRFELANVLAGLGMRLAFSPKADFSGMTGKKDLYISRVIHQAYVDVNEEGTEAAAATAVVMRLTALSPAAEKTFRADHPFLFLIRHNPSGTILFLGRLARPEPAGE